MECSCTVTDHPKKVKGYRMWQMLNKPSWPAGLKSCNRQTKWKLDYFFSCSLLMFRVNFIDPAVGTGSFLF